MVPYIIIVNDLFLLTNALHFLQTTTNRSFRTALSERPVEASWFAVYEGRDPSFPRSPKSAASFSCLEKLPDAINSEGA